jgi:hypothetical protein
MYAIADKYGIPSLKELAKKRFSKWAKTNWVRGDFPDTLREIFRSTPSSDQGLRDVAARIAAEHFGCLIKTDGFRVVVAEIGELGLGVLELAAEWASVRRKALYDANRSVQLLETELDTCKEALRSRNSVLASMATDLSSKVKMINELDHCSFCDGKFNMTVVQQQRGRIAEIRCRACKTGHK